MSFFGKRTHQSTQHWLAQRATALALIPLTLWFIFQFLHMMRATYTTTLQWVSHPFTSMVLALFLLTLLYHAYLGIRVIIEDYIHTPRYQYGSLILLKFLVLALGALSLTSIIRIIVLNMNCSICLS
jgi:succinate dehydrogenase / fumarate reductase membrane anchor subunit